MARQGGKPGVVYVLRCRFGVKIGATQRPIEKRLNELEKKLDFQFVRAIYSDDPYGLELHFHRRFKEKRLDAWQSSEFFVLDESDLVYISALTELDGHQCRHYHDLVEAICSEYE